MAFTQACGRWHQGWVSIVTPFQVSWEWKRAPLELTPNLNTSNHGQFLTPLKNWKKSWKSWSSKAKSSRFPGSYGYTMLIIMKNWCYGWKRIVWLRKRTIVFFSSFVLQMRPLSEMTSWRVSKTWSKGSRRIHPQFCLAILEDLEADWSRFRRRLFWFKNQ